MGLIVFGVLLVALFVVIAAAQGIGAPSVPSGSVAIVEDLPSGTADVTQDEFDRALEQQALEAELKRTPKPGDPKYDELKETAMKALLNSIALRGEAEELGISVTEKQVAAELEKIKEQSFPTEAAYKKFLAETSLTQEEVDERVEQQIFGAQIQERTSAKVPPPSSEAIEAYYEAEKSTKFATPERRDVRFIVNEDKSKVEAALKLLEADHSTASWEKVAPKYSSDETSSKQGGLQKSVPGNFLKGNIQEAIFGNPTGELSGLLKFENTYYVFEPIKAYPEKVKTLAESRNEIVTSLAEQQQQEYTEAYVNEFQAKWRSRTFCADGFVVSACSNYVGSGHPSNASPGCYEADPKGGIPKECPAPVEQLQPALPGTVTVLKPKGEQFPQRPLPIATAEQGEEVPTEASAGAAPPEE